MTMRLRYRRELTELEIEDALALPALDPMHSAEVRTASVLECAGRAVLFLGRVVVFTLGRIVLPILGELVCLAFAGAGLLGRAFDHVGRAAARRSWLLTAAAEALAELPAPRRVERVQNGTTITVRRER